MQSKISSMLDAVADSLEARGLIKEAYEIDKVADLVEKTAGMPVTLQERGEFLVGPSGKLPEQKSDSDELMELEKEHKRLFDRGTFPGGRSTPAHMRDFPYIDAPGKSIEDIRKRIDELKRK